MKKIESSAIVVCALYRFVRIEDPSALQLQLLELLKTHTIKGTLLVAAEGINGTVAGSREAIDILRCWLKEDERFRDISFKESQAFDNPFLRTRVKLKKEIVAMGIEDIDPSHLAGTYVKAEDWNELISSPDVITIDTRNEYEVEVGSFKYAVNPKTSSFREFPKYIASHLDKSRNKKIAMFCTGGIRCEKSSAYLKSLGYENVYHLEGGILNYLEKTDAANSLWQGECFVFDDRVTVGQDLEPGSYDQCHACRTPISNIDKDNEAYEKGVSCPHCRNQKSDADRERFRERELQMRLAESRGEAHIGAAAVEAQAERSSKKRRNRQHQREKNFRPNPSYPSE